MTGRRILVMAEQANEKWDVQYWQWMVSIGGPDYALAMLQRGVFNGRGGMRSRQKLESIGVPQLDTQAFGTNLLPPGHFGKDWYRSAAQRFMLFTDVTHFVLCGRKVATAFDQRFRRAAWGTWRNVWLEASAIIVPHPSGRCRVWNDRAEVNCVRVNMHLFLHSTPNLLGRVA